MNRNILFALWLALTGVQAQAEGLRVWVNDAVMTADGSTVTYLTVCQTDPTDNQYVGFQMQMRVPEGIHIAQRKQGRVYVNDATLNEQRFEGLGHALSVNMPEATLIKLSCMDATNNAPFYPDDAEGNTVEELFTIGLTADATMTNGTYTVTLSGVDFIHSDGSSNSPESEVSFRLTVTGGQEPVVTSITYTLPEAGIGTVILPYAAALPEGVSAYRCTGVEGTSVVLEAQSEIAANTPLLLMGTPSTYTFTGTSEAVENSYTSGVMTGVLQAEEITSGYVLQQQEGVTGFYRVGSSITVPANRCYLNVDSNVKMLSLKFIEDGVETVKKALEDGEAFDLGGRRVTRTQKGVYIRNGKKVVIK